MDRSCDNCYNKYRLYDGKHCVFANIKPIENVCNRHSHICDKCEDDKAEYKYNEKLYCGGCLIEEFEVKEYTVTNYYHLGDFIGTDEDMEEVILGLDDDIKPLD